MNAGFQEAMARAHNGTVAWAEDKPADADNFEFVCVCESVWTWRQQIMLDMETFQH